LTRESRRILGARDDLSTVLGLIAWANNDEMVLSDFAKLNLASRVKLKEELAGSTYTTQEGRIFNAGVGERTCQGLCVRRTSLRLLTWRRTQETAVLETRPCVVWATET
jgi:hypothetical protein